MFHPISFSIQCETVIHKTFDSNILCKNTAHRYI